MLKRQIIFVFFFLFVFLGFFELIKIYKQSFQSKQTRDREIESSTQIQFPSRLISFMVILKILSPILKF